MYRRRHRTTSPNTRHEVADISVSLWTPLEWNWGYLPVTPEHDKPGLIFVFFSSFSFGGVVRNVVSKLPDA